MTLHVKKSDLSFHEKIPNQNISISVSDSSGLVIIDTTNFLTTNKTYSNIQIFKFKTNSRTLITANYQFVYSAAQIKEQIKKEKNQFKALKSIMEDLNVDPNDYVIDRWYSKSTLQESITFKKQKIIIQKKYSVNIDCSNYIIIY